MFPSHLKLKLVHAFLSLMFDTEMRIRRNVQSLAGNLNLKRLPCFKCIREPAQFRDEFLCCVNLLNISFSFLCHVVVLGVNGCD